MALLGKGGGPMSLEPPWPRRRVVPATAALTLAAALVRGLARPGRPMWLDEAISLSLARLPLPDLAGQLTGGEANGGLFTLLLHALLPAADRLGLDELAAARGLSAAFGVAAVPVFYLLGRRLASERVALLAAALLAVSQFHVYHSIEARSYALACLLVLLSTRALVELLEDSRPRRALALGLLAGLATWAHLLAALVLPAQALAACLHPRGRAAASALAGGVALGAVLSAAVAAIVIRGDVGQVGWIEPLSLDQVARVFVSLSGTARLLLVPAAGGAVAVLVALRRGGEARFGAVLALAWALVPLLLAVLVSAAKPLLVPRYLLVSLPGFLLLVALGLGSLRRTGWWVAGAVAALGLALYQIPRDRRVDPPWLPIDQVAARLVEVARPGDVLVVSHPAMARSLDRELARLGRGPGPERVSPWPGAPFGQGEAQRPALPDRIRGRTGVIFVTYAERPDAADLRRALTAAGTITAEASDRGVGLLRLALPAPAAPPEGGR